MMEFDFVSEVDKKFYTDNLLLNEDWGSGDNVDDLSRLLGVDNTISADDFMDSLPDDLGIPMLDGDDMLVDAALLKTGLPLVADSLGGLSDSSDSGLDCGSVIVKDEPLSPASSLSSDTQIDAASVQFMEVGNTQLQSFTGVLPTDIKLESPPLTPERTEFVDLVGKSVVTQPNNCVKIDFANKNAQTLQTKLPSGSKIITGANGVQIIQSPVSNSLAHVLNSKVKIQPKPPAPLQPRTATLSATAQGKPLVLTPEEFAKLTQQGVLKFQNPEDKTRLTTSPPAPPAVIPGPQPAILGTTHGNGSDFKLAKRQQRMIKNRESACLSRKRKKEYVKNVEKQLADFSDENARLKEQNDQLKKRIQMLQQENDKLKSSMTGSHVKKVTAVMTVLFLLSLNLGPLTGILNSGDTTKQLVEPRPVGLYHHSRNLLAFNDNIPADRDSPPQARPAWPTTNIHSINAAIEGLRKIKSGVALPRDLVMVRRLEEMNIPVSMCPSYFNSSESERLMNELTGWVLGHKAGMKAAADAAEKVNIKKDKPVLPRKRHLHKKYAAPRKLKAALKAGIPLKDKDRSQYEVQVFNKPDRNYHDFLEAIHRRNDTFYVVSFRRDHLLLPATTHNQTMRPRMSLLMPAVSTNETVDMPAGNIAMMQIDCEVMATKLLHLHKSTVPTEEDAQSNHSNHTAPPSVEQDRDQPRRWQQKPKWRQAP